MSNKMYISFATKEERRAFVGEILGFEPLILFPGEATERNGSKVTLWRCTFALVKQVRR